MIIKNINSYRLEQYKNNSVANNNCNNANRKQPKALSAKNITFGSGWGSVLNSIFNPRKKVASIMKFITNDKLNALKAFSQLDEFIQRNKLSVIIDSSRKRHKANPYYMVEIENMSACDTIVHGYGNTKEDAICNMITILAQWKERGLSLAHKAQQGTFSIPKFDTSELTQINSHLQMQFIKFKTSRALF